MPLPDEFLKRLEKILPDVLWTESLDNFRKPKVPSVRYNPLKNGKLPEIYGLQPVPNIERAYTVPAEQADSLAQGPEIQAGTLYQQSLPSMLPVLVLDPRPGELVLDLCAAPGSKTTQIAAAMNNTGIIVANEPIRARYYKLRSVLNLLGVTNAEPKMIDGRRLTWPVPFDRILVDAPCSSEGRFKTFEKKSYAYWSVRKIKEMAHKQKGLLMNASRLIKPGGCLVYSTCTFAPEENEAVVDWALRKCEGLRLVPVEMEGFLRYPALTEWEGRTFASQVAGCFRLAPVWPMEGFFIAKFTKE